MEISLVLKIAGIGLIVAILNVILSKNGRDEYAMLTVIAGVIAVLLMLIPQMLQLVDTVNSVFDF
ncbi:MAG TPA: stage III sporulation protein AC [Ruminococcaceae bacterium]|nr:stage III sporulation protein AC [Oscillospiraceae bacterium]